MAQTSSYIPCFHKTTAFSTSVEGSLDPALSEQGPSLPENDDHLEGEPTQEEDEGLYIPSFLEEALGGDGNLQIKMAHTMQAQERRDKKCFICQSRDHLMKGHYKEKKWGGAPTAKGASPKQVSSGDGQSLSARLSNISGSPSKVKGVPYLSLDPYCQFIGPKNWGKALIDDCTIPVPVIVLCLSAIFVRNINSSEFHFQSVALRSQYSDHAPEAVTLH